MNREPLNEELLRTALAPPWRYLEVVDETGSTNADLIARAAAGEDIDGIVLIAEHQTAGRGRMGRTWSDGCRGRSSTLSVGVGAADVPTDHVGLASAGRGSCRGRRGQRPRQACSRP